jgi:hypothetical protein
MNFLEKSKMALLREEMDVSHVMIDTLEFGGGGND